MADLVLDLFLYYMLKHLKDQICHNSETQILILVSMLQKKIKDQICHKSEIWF